MWTEVRKWKTSKYVPHNLLAEQNYLNYNCLTDEGGDRLGRSASDAELLEFSQTQDSLVGPT